MVIVKVSLQYVWEKQEFDDSEDDQQLEQDNLPERATKPHAAKPVKVKLKNPIEHKSTLKDKFGYKYISSNNLSMFIIAC